MAMIQVKYSCAKCGIKRADVSVVERSPREDVVEFVNRAALQCKADHDARSPHCVIDSFDDFMIPIDNHGETPVGNRPKLN